MIATKKLKVRMKIYIKEQNNQFSKHLDILKTSKVAKYKKSRLKEKSTVLFIETTKKLEQLNLDFLFDYQVFPEHILTSKSQWVEENRTMKAGDTIVQQIYIPPAKDLSLKIIFGVRVKEIISDSDRRGFSYETLEGHVETGISTFTVEEHDGRIACRIQTFSKPGTTLTKLFGPVFSTPYQSYCTNAALRNMKRQLENQ